MKPAQKQKTALHAALGLAAGFWTSKAAWRSWLLVALIVAGFYGAARLSIALNAISGELTNAAVGKNWPALGPLIPMNIAFLMVGALVTAVQGYTQQWIEIDWRRDLIGKLVSRWMSGSGFYRMERDGLADNADQRIGDDAFLYVDHSLRLLLLLAGVPISIWVFGMLLWTLGGSVSLSAIGLDWRIRGGFLLIGLAVILSMGALLLGAGLRLVPINMERQHREGDFRFALASIRLHAEEITLYRGEASEAQRLDRRFGNIVKNWYKLMWASALVTVLASLYGEINTPANLLLAYGRYRSGQIDYGTLTQIGGAVGGLSMSVYTLVRYLQGGDIYIWAAAVRRLDTFAAALQTPAPEGIRVQDTPAGGALMETRALHLKRPDGTPLAAIADHRFMPGERWWIRGPSGAGKSTFLRALAGIWPFGAGEIHRDAGAKRLFLPQSSYVPEGTLIDALCYPDPPGSFPPERCAEALTAVRLAALASRLAETAPWQQRLSPGEQQRLAFARVLLQAPDLLLLDEATSALDSDNQAYLYALLIERLPRTLILSVAHRESLGAFHSHQFHIGGDGQ